jgi:hypothetical protein
MSALTQVLPTAARKTSQPARLQTTLYDLVAAINAEVGADEEEAGLATMVHLLQTYRTTCTIGGKTYRLVCDGAARLCTV